MLACSHTHTYRPCVLSRRHLTDLGWENSVFNVSKSVLANAEQGGITPGQAANALADEYADVLHPIWGHRSKQVEQRISRAHVEEEARVYVYALVHALAVAMLRVRLRLLVNVRMCGCLLHVHIDDFAVVPVHLRLRVCVHVITVTHVTHLRLRARGCELTATRWPLPRRAAPHTQTR